MVCELEQFLHSWLNHMHLVKSYTVQVLIYVSWHCLVYPKNLQKPHLVSNESSQKPLKRPPVCKQWSERGNLCFWQWAQLYCSLYCLREELFSSALCSKENIPTFDRCSNSTINSDYDIQKLPVAKASLSQMGDIGYFYTCQPWAV